MRNYVWVIAKSDPEGKAFIIILIVFLVLAFLALTIRVGSRSLTRVALDASDYFCFLGFASSDLVDRTAKAC